MASLLATLTGNLYLVAGTAVLATLALATGWLPPRGNVIFFWARVWSRCLLWSSGVRVEVEAGPFAAGRAELPDGGHYIFMANHQSLFDIPVLLSTLPGQTRFLAKQSLFRIPLFGWAIRAGGFIPVDREDRSRARDVFRAAAARLRAGTSVLLFPEETRSRDGRLLPFQRGGFLLAIKSGLPIVPVGIAGTLGVQRKGSLRIRPARVRVRYGQPLAVGGYDLRRKDELIASVRREVAALAGAAEAPAAGVDAVGSRV
jgi:1-acyl-sn-glycerol-3-phosphate acyltransferase